MNCTVCGAPEEHFTGEDCVDYLLSKLEDRSMLVREITAWFDVIEGKYDNIVTDWPVDWLRRAREAVK